MGRKKAAPHRQSTNQRNARSRRAVASRSMLSELRRVQRHMQPAIPRLPFQRVVRQIAWENNIDFRWTPSALLCMQEALEDWLIEFFEDAYFLSAHAHRMTIMVRDFNTLRCIRHRQEKFLESALAGDRRMADILTNPPLHPRQTSRKPVSAKKRRLVRSHVEPNSPGITEVGTTEAGIPHTAPIIGEVSIEEEELARPSSSNVKAMEEEKEEKQEKDRSKDRMAAVQEQHSVNCIALEDYVSFNTVRYAFNVGGRREVGELRRVDTRILMQADSEMSDSTVKAALW